MKPLLRFPKGIVPCVLLAVAALGAQAKPVTLRGTSFSPPRPAVDFTLTDQNGRAFFMADTRGKVVVVSFIYTHCTDFCPFVALKLKGAAALLKAEAGRFVLVAVTTDPARDTPKVNAEYSRALGMPDSWHFVTGPLPAMREVWKDYFVGAHVVRETPRGQDARAGAPADPEARQAAAEQAQAVTRGLGGEDRRLVGRVIEHFGGGYEVSHDIPFWFVDKKGMLRAFLEPDATPADIAFNVKALLEE